MCNILVIDDEESVLKIINQALTRFGFSVETASDGVEGIKKFDDGFFDLVITDLCMPGIDGNGVAKHIRNSGGRLTQIIGMSGTPWLTDGGDFTEVLANPFSLTTLIETVRNLTGSFPLAAASG